MSNRGHLTGMFEQPIRIWCPIHLDAAGEIRHGIGLDPDAGHVHLLAFNDCRASAAKRIKNPMMSANAESFEVTAHHMRRVREHEPVPIVNRAIS